ncbi:DUF2252 domain-containing protein [Kineococcus sp. NUM-3379]
MTSAEARTAVIVDVLTEAFADLVAADPAAFRHKYRKMAADPFAFYRGTACLFFRDVAAREDPWADARTGRVWIQGDLHAQNFGTAMDGTGRLVFDVNDFDEAYLGHFTWDLRRLAASVALLGWTKALPDLVITGLVEVYVRAYLDQVHVYAAGEPDEEWSLRLGTATGAVRLALLEAQLSTRVGLLERVTVVDDYERRFRHGPGVRSLEDGERAVVEAAYGRYLDTIPAAKRFRSGTYTLKDVVGRSGFGIGSAGLPAYSLLVEGASEALENDVVLTVKQGGVPAASRVVDDPRPAECFEHQGHRTTVSRRALQAHADPWSGWCRMEGGPHDGVGFVVAEFSPYEADLDWSQLTEVADLAEVLAQLGRATAKAHCVSDVDDPTTPLVDFQVEDAVVEAVSGREDEFVEDVVAFAHEYGLRARTDHVLFVDAFRSGRIG